MWLTVGKATVFYLPEGTEMFPLATAGSRPVARTQPPSQCLPAAFPQG
jgi:hypothetical protein